MVHLDGLCAMFLHNPRFEAFELVNSYHLIKHQHLYLQCYKGIVRWLAIDSIVLYL